MHSAERKLLQAFQAAGFAALRRAGQGVATQARAEIAVAFAHRWAEIRRLPAARRAAAAAALGAEQAATLATRIGYLAQQQQHQLAAERAQLHASFGSQRRSLAAQHREAWARAAELTRLRARVHVEGGRFRGYSSSVIIRAITIDPSP